MKGIYHLVIFLEKQTNIKIGKKRCLFPRGYYCYVGSAMNNLEKRIQRHCNVEKKLHWHIDYLLRHAKVMDIRVKENSEDECGLGKDLKNVGGRAVCRGFGSSDCKCETHLFYFPKRPPKNTGLDSFKPKIIKSFK